MASSNPTAGGGKKTNVRLITGGLWHDDIAAPYVGPRTPPVDDAAAEVVRRASGQDDDQFPLQFSDSQEPLLPRPSGGRVVRMLRRISDAVRRVGRMNRTRDA
ncbi:hypothetical protein CDAR_53421 [Caerostris darwini]|uniref:Uncharacterized protein n=1 Tax=Caerostris darwini TaxID=1538125 RepID=A0AAV4TYW4_9ARAC|nr:hypothetical protein CDAR_53421 [Caerostris darwini]